MVKECMLQVKAWRSMENGRRARGTGGLAVIIKTWLEIEVKNE